ncbi:MAG: glycine cleavage system protein H [Armatimonadota bacterium]|nr:glycine cleavage system protein H [Armatimonadota bacterium]
MDTLRPETIAYKRSRFSTRLPVHRLYAPAHYWMAEEQAGLWRVGFTKFATRMLGDTVEYGFEVKAGDLVAIGQSIAWIEGFKALSQIYCVVAGEFAGTNPLLEQDITRIDADPYGDGWLYHVRGTADPKSVDVHGYMALLDATIEKMLEKQSE